MDIGRDRSRSRSRERTPDNLRLEQVGANASPKFGKYFEVGCLFYCYRGGEQFLKTVNDFDVKLSCWDDSGTSIHLKATVTSKNCKKAQVMVKVVEFSPHDEPETIATKSDEVSSTTTLKIVIPSQAYPIRVTCKVSEETSEDFHQSVMPINSTGAAVYEKLKNFGDQMFESRETTGDFFIITATAKHKVHMLVLKLQNPVFRAMMESNMKERQEDAVKIDGFDDQVVEYLIEYIYKGWTDGVNVLPENVLKIAHMFQVDGLIEFCWIKLMETLKIENAAKLLVLAHLYDGDSNRKKKVAEYLFENHMCVKKTEGYSLLIKEQPDLYLEICNM